MDVSDVGKVKQRKGRVCLCSTNRGQSTLDNRRHNVRKDCPVYAFFFVFPFISLSKPHIPLSRPVTSLFILIFHPLPHACTRNIQSARRVSFFSLFSDHVIDHLIAMRLPHGFVVTDPIAPSQSVSLLVSMFVLCWKPNMVRVPCTFQYI